MYWHQTTRFFFSLGLAGFRSPVYMAGRTCNPCPVVVYIVVMGANAFTLNMTANCIVVLYCHGALDMQRQPSQIIRKPQNTKNPNTKLQESVQYSYTLNPKPQILLNLKPQIPLNPKPQILLNLKPQIPLNPKGPGPFIAKLFFFRREIRTRSTVPGVPSHCLGQPGDPA